MVKQAMAAAGEVGPFILTGHSVGGQLALSLAALETGWASGLALLDSYSEFSIKLDGKQLKVSTALRCAALHLTALDCTRLCCVARRGAPHRTAPCLFRQKAWFLPGLQEGSMSRRLSLNAKPSQYHLTRPSLVCNCLVRCLPARRWCTTPRPT